MVIGQIIREGIKYAVRSSGAGLIPKGYRAYRKYDIQTTNRLFGKSGGKGFRHGRDLGLILGEYVGDDLDRDAIQPPQTSSKFKARGKYRRSRNRNRVCHDRCDNSRRYSKSR